MKTLPRFNEERLVHDLEQKMVMLSGPRQCGKTTLARSAAQHFASHDYLNYDSDRDRKVFLTETWDRQKELLILDEIHKFRNWKTKIKGIYDTEGNLPRILVTGSARINLLRRAGDSLVGRYFHHRLYPFTYRELAASIHDKDLVASMLRLGSFPEPFLSGSEASAKRWRKNYLDLVTTQDIVQLEDVKNLSSLRLLVDLLRERVGSPVSFKSLAEDLSISPHTVRRYVEILESAYLIFRVTPFHRNIARAISKEPKIYFFDVGLVQGGDGARLENLVALHLLKHLHFLEDTTGADTALHYIRDRSGREVDFYVRADTTEPAQLVEVKSSDHSLSKNVAYFQQRLALPAIQVVAELRRSLQQQNIRSLPLANFLSSLSC